MSQLPEALKVMIAEDHELTRYGLAMALEDKCGLPGVLQAENGEQAVAMAQAERPHVILMDIGMPLKDGITATREIKGALPDTKIIMLTSRQESEEVFAALASGADAYCMKDIKIDRLCQVIEMVMDGATWLDPAIAQTVLHALPDHTPLASSAVSGSPSVTAVVPPTTGTGRKRYNTELTEREREVLEYIVQGKSNKEIAVMLDVTVHTAKAHVCNIIQKLAVDDRTQVAVKAIQQGLVELN